MCWFGTLLQEAIIPCFLVTVFKIKLMFMFVERNQGIYQSSFVVLMLHIVYSIVAVLQVWYCVNLLIAKLFIHKPRLWNRDHTESKLSQKSITTATHDLQ
jgi:hypothetical protein